MSCDGTARTRKLWKRNIIFTLLYLMLFQSKLIKLFLCQFGLITLHKGCVPCYGTFLTVCNFFWLDLEPINVVMTEPIRLFEESNMSSLRKWKNDQNALCLCHKQTFAMVPIYLQPDCVKLRHFLFWFFELTKLIVWHIWGLQQAVAKI